MVQRDFWLMGREGLGRVGARRPQGAAAWMYPGVPRVAL